MSEALTLVVLNDSLAYQFNGNYYDVQTLTLKQELGPGQSILIINEKFINLLKSKLIIYSDKDYGGQLFTTDNDYIYVLYDIKIYDEHNYDIDSLLMAPTDCLREPCIMSIPDIHILDKNISYVQLPEMVFPEVKKCWVKMIKEYCFGQWDLETQMKGFSIDGDPLPSSCIKQSTY